MLLTYLLKTQVFTLILKWTFEFLGFGQKELSEAQQTQRPYKIPIPAKALASETDKLHTE